MDDASALEPCAAAAARPYHHGDLRRALVEAAERVLERDGPQALSLRAVAREAGVSPAAPYHHFKDKNELLLALASDGFVRLGEALDAAVPDGGPLSELGLAYVRFARENPALYRVMYDCARNQDAMPDHEHAEGKKGGYGILKESLIKAGADPSDELGLELACVTSWCAAHGVSEMAGFTQFKPLIEALGGEDAFVQAVLSNIAYKRFPPAP